MKKISLAILTLLVALTACKKVPEVNLKYVDVERDLITVGTTTATVQCDYQYIATLKKAYLYYGEGVDEVDMNTAEMRVVHNTLYVDLASLKENTTYSYYYEFHNGFNSMRTVAKTFKTEGSGTTITLPTVVTAEVTEITTSSAKSGGEVTNDGGAEVTDRGICWGINANPTLSDSHVAAGTGMGTFTAMMENLEANTTYHIRAYATNEKGTAYGLDREFVTVGGGSGDNEWVDLGLPSGTLWATCNVGANSPEEYGDYFAWGETEPKSIYNWSTYKYCHGDCYSMTKYCNNPNYGFNGFTDNLIVLEAIDDAATINWGNAWLMPTEAQWSELFENTTNVWTTYNGVTGQLFTSTNGASIFLPAAGNHWEGEFFNEGIHAAYWSSTLEVVNPMTAWYTNIDSYDCKMSADNRFGGHSIRPVRRNENPIPPTPPGVPEGAINGLFTINANGDQVYFSKGNLQYQASTNTWRFAENQWDYVGSQDPSLGDAGGTVEGSDNVLISSTYDGWIDLFRWGTSGYNHGAVCYQPWSTSSYFADFFAYGKWSNNLNDGNGQADWGYNCISNGGNQENLWRTLSIQEWQYVINTRNTVSGIRYTRAKVNGVNGLILLPDGWTVSVFPLNDTNDPESVYDSNEISLSQWEDMLEPNGAIFLPVTGYMSSGVCWPDRAACYFSSSFKDDQVICSVYIWNSILSVDAGAYRRISNAVRLVQDANP